MSYDVNDLDFTISLVGDVLLTRRMNVFDEDGFLKLRDLLHSSHATFANLETTVRHWDEGKIGRASCRERVSCCV